MSWCLVVAPEKVYAELKGEEVHSIPLKDWSPHTVGEAIRQVDLYMDENYRRNHAGD